MVHCTAVLTCAPAGGSRYAHGRGEGDRVARALAATPASFVLLALLALLAVLAGPAAAQQDPRQGAPGQFDFYVLALSWSPSYCAASAEQGRKPPRPQCAGRPYSFVVHGLWPQYERGFPEYCQVPAPRLNRTIVGRMLDQMPAPGLIFHQWNKHGTCTGLTRRRLFRDRAQGARRGADPGRIFRAGKAAHGDPAAVKEAFLKANPGLSAAGIAVTCDNRRLREVRICMTRAFGFRECAEVSRRICRRDQVLMPPMRGGPI